MYLHENARKKFNKYPYIHNFVKNSFLNIQSKARNSLLKTVDAEKLLWGGENAISSAKYARITDNLLRPSTLLKDTPHVKFLKLFERIGEEIFDKQVFENTEYFKNASEAIEITGDYFGIVDREDLIKQGKRFVSLYKNIPSCFDATSWKGVSPRKAPITVRRIKFSDGCYEIVDGHHRLAVAFMHGFLKYRVYVLIEHPEVTPLQALVLDCVWTKGAKELYQPIDFPEFGNKWVLVRRCVDRLDFMSSWLEQHNYNSLKKTYIDIGSSYGWFVAEMQRRGFLSFGVERDPSAINIGKIAYGLAPDKIKKIDIVDFCNDENQKFDIVSCFSVLHHFALGKSKISAEKFIKLLDKITGSVLFIDTGQSHEQWFRESLPEWTEDFIKEWISKNSSFTSIEKIGVDGDSKLSFKNNYGRILFACTRNQI